MSFLAVVRNVFEVVQKVSDFAPQIEAAASGLQHATPGILQHFQAFFDSLKENSAAFQNKLTADYWQKEAHRRILSCFSREARVVTASAVGQLQIFEAAREGSCDSSLETLRDAQVCIANELPLTKEVENAMLTLLRSFRAAMKERSLEGPLHNPLPHYQSLENHLLGTLLSNRQWPEQFDQLDRAINSLSIPHSHSFREQLTSLKSAWQQFKSLAERQLQGIPANQNPNRSLQQLRQSVENDLSAFRKEQNSAIEEVSGSLLPDCNDNDQLSLFQSSLDSGSPAHPLIEQLKERNSRSSTLLQKLARLTELLATPPVTLRSLHMMGELLQSTQEVGQEIKEQQLGPSAYTQQQYKLYQESIQKLQADVVAKLMDSELPQRLGCLREHCAVLQQKLTSSRFYGEEKNSLERPLQEISTLFSQLTQHVRSHLITPESQKQFRAFLNALEELPTSQQRDSDKSQLTALTEAYKALKNAIDRSPHKPETLAAISKVFKEYQVFLGALPCNDLPLLTEGTSRDPFNLDALRRDVENALRVVNKLPSPIESLLVSASARQHAIEEQRTVTNRSVSTFCEKCAEYAALSLCCGVLGLPNDMGDPAQFDVRSFSGKREQFLEGFHHAKGILARGLYTLTYEAVNQILSELLLGSDPSQGVLGATRESLNDEEWIANQLRNALAHLGTVLRTHDISPRLRREAIYALQEMVVDNYSKKPDLSIRNIRIPLLTTALEKLCALIKRTLIKWYLRHYDILPWQIESFTQMIESYPIVFLKIWLHTLRYLSPQDAIFAGDEPQPIDAAELPEVAGTADVSALSLFNSEEHRKLLQEFSQNLIHFLATERQSTDPTVNNNPLRLINGVEHYDRPINAGFDHYLANHILPGKIRMVVDELLQNRHRELENYLQIIADCLNEVLSRPGHKEGLARESALRTQIEQQEQAMARRLTNEGIDSQWKDYALSLHKRSSQCIQDVRQATKILSRQIATILTPPAPLGAPSQGAAPEPLTQEPDATQLLLHLQTYCDALLHLNREIFARTNAQLEGVLYKIQTDLKEIMEKAKAIDHHQNHKAQLLQQCEEWKTVLSHLEATPRRLDLAHHTTFQGSLDQIRTKHQEMLQDQNRLFVCLKIQDHEEKIRRYEVILEGILSDQPEAAVTEYRQEFPHNELVLVDAYPMLIRARLDEESAALAQWQRELEQPTSDQQPADATAEIGLLQTRIEETGGIIERGISDLKAQAKEQIDTCTRNIAMEQESITRLSSEILAARTRIDSTVTGGFDLRPTLILTPAVGLEQLARGKLAKRVQDLIQAFRLTLQEPSTHHAAANFFAQWVTVR